MILLRSADWETQYASVCPSQGKIRAVDLHKAPRQPIAVQMAITPGYRKLVREAWRTQLRFILKSAACEFAQRTTFHPGTGAGCGRTLAAVPRGNSGRLSGLLASGCP